MTHREIAQQRLRQLQIAASRFRTPAEVVGWLGALQGQDYAGAKWSIGLRLRDCTDADVERAIVERSVVRTWTMRGTLHLVAAADVRWIVGLLGPRQLAASARRYRELELDERTLQHSSALVTDALARDGQQDRRALFGLLEAGGISTAGQRGIHMLQYASLHGLICQVGAVRNVALFAAMDDIPPGPTLAPATAAAELARRFFQSHGPATLRDFVRWTGLTMTDARAALAAIQSQLSEQAIGGETYWLAGTPATGDGQGVFALPGFDEYLLGYADRSAVLEPQYADRIVPGGNGVFYPTIVSNGAVVGTWRRTVKRAQVVVTPEPFTSLSAAELAGFGAAVAAYGRFLQQPATMAAPAHDAQFAAERSEL